MQTVTSNTTQQINSALFALDRDMKNIEGNMDLQTQILTEAQTRSNADTALTNSINNVASELSQAQLTAYAYGESGSAATAVTQVITISGSTSYNAAAGSRVLVSFPNGYTPSNEDSELLLQIGNMAALPALAQGVAMKYGSVTAGAMIEFTYTGSAWCCQSNIVKATSDYTIYTDGQKELLSYSTTEQTTGKKWTDGKLIYRKTVICSVTGITSTAHNISNLNEITKIEAKSLSVSGETRPIPFCYFGNSEWDCGVYVSNTNIWIEAGVLFSEEHTTATVTLEYTKTTD